MSKSLIYTVNDKTQNVLDGGLVNLGTVVRRFGCNCALVGNGIVLEGTGYYTIDVTASVSPTEVGAATLTAYKDGAPIPGMSVTGDVTAAGDSVSLALSGVVRLPCCSSATTITFGLSGVDADVLNFPVTIRKE